MEKKTNDFISRADAIEAVGKLLVDGQTAIIDGKLVPLHFALINVLSSLPSAKVQDAIEALREISILAKPKTGKWIIKKGNYCGVELKEFFCDKCGTRGALRRVFSDPEPLPNFCGHCGADMRGGEE